jgi:hypothetical protein
MSLTAPAAAQMFQQRLGKQFRKRQGHQWDTVRQHKYAVAIGTVAATAARCAIVAGNGGTPHWTWMASSLILTREAGNKETSYCYSG